VARSLLYLSTRERQTPERRTSRRARFTEDAIMVFIVLWLLGVPLGLIVLLWLLGVFS
jgi:hypothetical protein